MRNYFYQVHELMAIELIKCIHEKDTNATNFLLFYSGKTILINHQKYIIPSLETEDGRQWNSSSLIGICNLWMNTKKRKELYEHKLVDTNMRLDEINQKLAYIKPEIELQEGTIRKTEEQAEVITKKHEELERKLNYLENTSLNSTEYFAFEKKVAVSAVKVNALEEITKEAKMNLKAIKDANTTTYTELEFFTNQKQELLQDVKAQNFNVNSKSAQMDPIIESIIKVLMERTKLMEND